MKNKPIRNRRLGIILLITAAVISTVLLVPGVVLGLQTTFQNGKEPALYKVGETVTFQGAILFNGAAEEIANISSVTLNVQPDSISASPGTEAFTSTLPFNIGSFDLTSQLPADMQSRGSTLEVDVTWTDLGPGPGGYSAGGYKGSTVNARIDFAIRWLPPVLRLSPPAPLPPLISPVSIFNNPGAGGGGGATLAVDFLFEVPIVPEAPAGSEVLGLAYDRAFAQLLILMNNPSGNDTLLVVDPTFGFIFDVIDVGVSDAQDVTWQGDPGTGFTTPGSVWIARGTSSPDKELIKIGTLTGTGLSALSDTPFALPGSVPIAGLGINPYSDGDVGWLIASDLNSTPTGAIPVWARRASDGLPGIDLDIPAAPTGGGYNDVAFIDPESAVAGAFGGKLGLFDLGGALFGSFDVEDSGTPLTNVTGIAFDIAGPGVVYLSESASQGKIYSTALAGGGGGDFARAITNDPSGNIFLLMDNAGTNNCGVPCDKIIEVNDSGTQINFFDAPTSGVEGLAFLGGSLYTVNNLDFPPSLIKVDPSNGTIDSDYPKSLPGFVGSIGGMTVNSAGTELILMSQFSDDLFFVDPATATVTFSTTLFTTGFSIPSPFGLESITLVTGAPTGPFLLGGKFAEFWFIDPSTGEITDFKPVTTFPPFSITGLTQRGDVVLFTDDSQQVFKAGVPGAPPPETTVAGDYKATFAVTHNPTDTETVLFTIETVPTLVVAITDPSDGDSFTSTPITVTGTVNDPTVTTVTLGIDLPSTTLLGPATFEGGSLDSFTTTGLWHATDDFIDPGNPRVNAGTFSLAYTRDADNVGTAPPGPLYTYNTFGTNSGTATSDDFTIGENSELSFWTWYFTEPNFIFDKKLINIVPSGGSPITIAQIVDIPPTGPDGFPLFGAAPGTVFSNSFIAPYDLVYIPTAIFAGPAPVFTQVNLPLDDFVGQTGAIQFAFDTVDGTVNDFEGWFVDDVSIVGAGAATDVDPLPVVNGTFSGAFPLAPGSNDILVTASRTAYDPQTATDSITISLDISNPILTLLLTEDVNSNGVLDEGEDINGDGLLTTLANGVEPLETNNPVQVVFGTYVEDNPSLLTVKVNDKLVLSKKTFDSADPTFSTIVNLKNGSNDIVVNLVDAGGLESNPAGDPLATVTVDIAGPTLTALSTIYPFTFDSAKPGDPVVYQITASDAETGVASVEIFSSPGQAMFEASQVPEVLRDQWQTTGSHIFPTVISPTAPPGPLSLIVRATDGAGNTTETTVSATVVASMTAWNSCLQQNANLVSVPIQPDDPDGAGSLLAGDIDTLLGQVVPNVNSEFTSFLPTTTVKLSDVVESITYYDAATSTFEVFAGLGSDTLSNLSEGKAYWIFTKTKFEETTGVFKDIFQQADPLPGFTTPSFSCMTMTTSGQFLTPSDVPPVFTVLTGWNMVGPHTEGDKNVDQFLAGVTFPARVWTSLLNFQNGVTFDYENAGALSIKDRVTQTLGAFESRQAVPTPDAVNRGEGFWLFVVADGLITP